VQSTVWCLLELLGTLLKQGAGGPASMHTHIPGQHWLIDMTLPAVSPCALVTADCTSSAVEPLQAVMLCCKQHNRTKENPVSLKTRKVPAA
jgi:hypothetical protein